MHFFKLDINIINKLEEFINNGNIKTNNSYLLDKLNITDFISKIVYNIAIHNQIINIENMDKYIIEFNFINTNQDNKFDIVYDKEYYKNNNIKKSPEVTVLTYIIGNPTLYITNINNDKYNYKDFYSGELTVLQPCKSVIISHNNFYNKSIHKGNSYILMTNLWIDKPTNTELYVPDNNKFTYTDNEMKNIIHNYDYKNKIINSNIINYNFFHRLLYHDDLNIIDNYIKNNNINPDDIITIHNHQTENSKSNNANNKKVASISKDRFVQRFIYKNIFCDIVCDWLIFEFNSINNSNKEKKQIININDIPNIQYFILRNLQKIIKKINQYYNIPDSINVNIDSVNIVEHSIYNDVNEYNNAALLHIHIPLNSYIHNYDGGEYVFNDDTIQEIDSGDMFVFLNKNDDYIKRIVVGKKYYLFAELNYEL